MKKVIFLAIACVSISLSVSAQSQNAKFVAPKLSSQESSTSSTIDPDLTRAQKQQKISQIVAKKTTSLQNAKETMLSEVKVALSNDDREKAFEKRSDAWKKEADAKNDAEKTYVQEILDII